MKIAVIGTGYVGLVQGVIMSEFGSEVICVDKSDEKIEKLKKGELPIYEPGLLELLHKNQKAKRISFTTDTEEAVKALFIKVAKELKYYQAIRHTLGALRFPNGFDTTWEKGSGTLPNALDLDSCKANAWQLIEKVLNKSNQQWTKETFETTLQKFLTLFDEHFFDDLKLLVYYQGEDFAKALTKELPNFSIENYYKYAKKHFDYTKYFDLVELRAIIEKHLV